MLFFKKRTQFRIYLYYGVLIIGPWTSSPIHVHIRTGVVQGLLIIRRYVVLASFYTSKLGSVGLQFFPNFCLDHLFC